MMTLTPCPNTDHLRAYSTGQLSEGEMDSLYEHLQDCNKCQSELDTIDDANDSLIADLRIGHEEDDYREEPNCNLALTKALAALATSESASAEPTEFGKVPQQIGEYEIHGPIGRGGMGRVYLASHSKLGRKVAIKILARHRLGDERMRQRFDAEMRAVGRLSHPNIVTAHDAREIEGGAVLITEHIDGFDLAELVRRSGPLRVPDACEIVSKVAAALQYISDQGFVHRDIKPSNVMISRRGEVKLLDLGLARFETPDDLALTGTGQAVGTPDFVAPEQVADGRSVDHRSDIYSLGCTLFALLTGHAPFSDSGHQTAFSKMNAHVSETPPSLASRLSDCPGELNQIVESMLAKDAKQRPQNSGKIAASLSPFCIGHDLTELVAKAAESDPKEHPLPESKSIQTQPWRQRTVPLPRVMLIGLLSGIIGLMMGLFIKITLKDGTVLKFPAENAKVEIVGEEDAKRPSAAPGDPNLGAGTTPDAADPGSPFGGDPFGGNSSGGDPFGGNSGGNPFGGNSGGDPFGGNPFGSGPPTPPGNQSVAPNRLQPPVAPYQILSGLWLAERLGERHKGSDETTVVSFQGSDFRAITALPSGAPLISYGQIQRFQRDNRGLTMLLADDATGRKMECYIRDPSGKTLLLEFDPFTIPKTVPLQGNRPFDRGEVMYRLTRLGAVPTTPDEIQELMKSLPVRPGKTFPQAVIVHLQTLKLSGNQLMEAMQEALAAKDVSTTSNHLKQIGIAFHNFHEVYQKFPGSVNRLEGSAGSSKKEIQPFSWRVAILPFIEQLPLFEQYDFNEPWNSENNLKVLDQMPEVYRSPRAAKDQPSNHTNYLGFATGDSALGTDGGISLREIRDGATNTLLVIESKKTVPWTKPEDFTDLSELDVFTPSVHLRADGSVHRDDKLEQGLLKILITRDGGELFPKD